MIVSGAQWCPLNALCSNSDVARESVPRRSGQSVGSRSA